MFLSRVFARSFLCDFWVCFDQCLESWTDSVEQLPFPHQRLHLTTLPPNRFFLSAVHFRKFNPQMLRMCELPLVMAWFFPHHDHHQIPSFLYFIRVCLHHVAGRVCISCKTPPNPIFLTRCRAANENDSGRKVPVSFLNRGKKTGHIACESFWLRLNQRGMRHFPLFCWIQIKFQRRQSENRERHTK